MGDGLGLAEFREFLVGHLDQGGGTRLALVVLDDEREHVFGGLGDFRVGMIEQGEVRLNLEFGRFVVIDHGVEKLSGQLRREFWQFRKTGEGSHVEVQSMLESLQAIGHGKRGIRSQRVKHDGGIGNADFVIGEDAGHFGIGFGGVDGIAFPDAGRTGLS